MLVELSVLGVYILGVFSVGWWARSRWSASAESYFLADRKLGPLIFLATMAATNFSAFTVFGASGAGYREGFAFYPVIGFGTGFMALTFWLVGRRARALACSHGAVTPAELIRALYDSRIVSTIFALVLIIFTIPYLALQPIAAGYALQELLGWDYLWGASLITLIITLYTLRGGLRAVAWTDALQGLVMFGILALALILIAGQAGGLGGAGRRLLELKPELFSRPGGEGRYLITIWFSYMMLWFFCDPMFPQLFQRFMAARDDRTIRRTMLAYPLVCSAVFFLPVTIGVLGHLTHPGLTGKAADRILPLLAVDLGSPVLGALIIACGLAALMSTMDSQLLTLSSIFSQDIYPLLGNRKVRQAWPGRVFVILLAGAGLALAVNPPGTILSIARESFTGLAVLFPTVIFGLYPGWKSNRGAVVSILVGEGALVLSLTGHLPRGDFLAVMPIMLLTFVSYLAVSGLEKYLAGGRVSISLRLFRSPYTWGFVAILGLSQDWWRWHQSPVLWWGLPSWIFYFVLLSLVQTWLMSRWSRDPGVPTPSARH